MELLAYILIMLAMGGIGWLCMIIDQWLETPLAALGTLASAVFAIMFVLLVAAGICVALGVEVSA